MDQYSLFLPPDHLAIKKPPNYSKNEAKDFFQFVMQEKPRRIEYFLEFISIQLIDTIANDLKKISAVVFIKLNNPLFSFKNNSLTELTNEGYSFCFDLGLLMGDLIINEMPDVKWVIGKGPKTYQGNNMPVIKNEKSEYDVLGISIHSSEFALNHNKPQDWYDQYITMIKTLNNPTWWKEYFK